MEVQAPVPTEANSAEPETIDVARTSEPAPKKPALEYARKRRVNARLESLEERQDRLEQTMKANYEILSQAIKVRTNPTTGLHPTAIMDGTMATGTANHRNRAQTQQHHLLVWQWNPNSIQGRKALLQQYIQQCTERPDVIILQETHSETPPTLQEYRSFVKPPLCTNS
ncbi:hypothetical protein MRX96_026145 [Rhipicephalus microplus]